METNRSVGVPHWRGVLPALVVLAGILAFASSFRGTFLFDDHISILNNLNIRRLGTCMLHTTRPLVGLTLFLNLAAGGFDPAGYHLFNLAVHLLASLVLYGAVRRTLSLAGWGTDDAARAILAACAAAIWVVHPLQTESVTYIIQRSESMMGLFYLLTMYCAIRGFERHPDPASGIRHPASRTPNFLRTRWVRRTQRAAFWHMLAVIACSLGMVSKPVMVTAPLMVLLYDRLFVSRSFANALRARRSFYVLLAMTWIVPAAILSVPHESSTSAGYGARIVSPVAYLLTQPGVIFHYLGLVFRPGPLCLDYAWPPAASFGEVAGPVAIIAALLGLTVALAVRRKPLSFTGIWFFLVLASTSSIVPVADYAVEHRMYLPLAGPVVLLLAGAYGGWQRVRERLPSVPRPSVLILGGTLVVVAALVPVTAARNRDYRSQKRMWESVLEVRPDNVRAHLGIGAAALGEGGVDEARRRFDTIISRVPDLDTAARMGLRTEYALTRNNLGVLCEREGRYEEAESHFREALRVSSEYGDARRNLAIVLRKKENSPE